MKTSMSLWLTKGDENFVIPTGFWWESMRLDARQRHSGMTGKGIFG
jgi:hypothetical protein